ncbi:MAG: hypothetical protein WAK50_02430 [Nitrososphaeraceae archaeon]
MINNLIQGTDDYPCDCVHNNVANGSFTKVTPDLRYADLITCGMMEDIGLGFMSLKLKTLFDNWKAASQIPKF